MLTITDAAATKIQYFLSEDSDAKGLRVYVKGGGCHGYSYGMALEHTIEEDDTVITMNGVKVIVDPQSAPLLQGSEVDYTDTLQGSGFAIKNPQAKTTCGCGSSFS
jgi:iron-sulfur cluster insertion protein